MKSLTKLIKAELLDEIRSMDFDYLLSMDALEFCLWFGPMSGAKRPVISLVDSSLHAGDKDGRIMSESLYVILREWLESDADCHETNEPSDQLIAILERCIRMIKAHQNKLARLYEANQKGENNEHPTT